jgi:tetratricopeptide (TPR) repeat protein/DNA-binding XRE family transcriptional regulator
VTLRPGAVKQARNEAGLSLAQVGRGHVTAPAIYLIETGRTRPSLPTLEHIARQTNKPVEFFLADPDGAVDETHIGVLELEATVAAGRHEDAVRQGQALLDRGASVHRLGRIRFLLGQAYLGSGQHQKAAILLDEAKAHFEAVNDGAMLAECIGAQAALVSLTEPKEALALVETALATCRGLNPVPEPTLARLLGILASVHAARRDWDSAIAAYEAAIEAAATFFDLRRLAGMYGDLSTAYQERGAAETAVRYGMRSVALFEVLRDQVGLARSTSELGRIYLSRGNRAEARKHLDRSLQVSQEANREDGRSAILLSLCDLSLQDGKVEQAYDFAQQALELAERLHEPGDIATAHCWLGRACDGAGNYEGSDREFELGIRMFEGLAMRDRLLNCHRAYAECLERRGELAKAYQHMKQALQASRPGMLRDKEREEKVSTA